jgi:bifunctional non-homologous end joining protein LigD
VKGALRPLPAPMLLKPATFPLGSGYSYELKWDGFRAIVSTEESLRVRTRRGREIAPQLPELEALPPGLVLDGELVAFDNDGRPSFAAISDRLLHRRSRASVTFVAFDVLVRDGATLLERPFVERRAVLEDLELARPAYVPPVFDDGQALFEAACREGHEGIVAKRLRDPYRPGERRWLKLKNRDYWRFGQELRPAR